MLNFMNFPFLFLTVLISLTTVYAQTKPINFAELETTIEAELKANKTPGAAVAIVVGDKIVYAKGFGTTSAENSTNPINADTLFRMGSTTKMFTAAALISQADAGKIKLDAPVGNYIKNLPPKIAALTAHHLLSQSSGLRDFAPLITTDDDAGLKQNILAWKEDVFFTEPSKIYSYSSPNYWLAGFLIEELTGKFYSDAMSELIFKPLGMTRSTIRPLAAMTYPLALGHNIENGNAVVIRPIANNVAKYPGGSMYSSANELARFAIAMLNGGKLGGKQTFAPMIAEKLFAPQFYLPGEDKTFYSYGLVGFETGGVKVLSHGGVSSGYGSTIEFIPEHKYAIIVLANRNGETLGKSRRKAMELALPLNPEKDDQPKPMAISAEEMKRYVGSYSHAPMHWEVFIKEGKLFLKQDGKDFALEKIGKDRFGYEQGEAVFTQNAKGEIEHISFGLYSARKTAVK
jgi:CubicO group peptidase (beta-lactamase class C family)